MKVGHYWVGLLLAGVLVLPVPVVSDPEVARAVEPTVVSGLELAETLQVGQQTKDRVRVSGPAGRAVQVQFRSPGAQWTTVVTLATNARRRVPVSVAVTATGGRLVWQARQPDRLWAVAGRTDGSVGTWRVRAPAVPGWTRSVSPAERVQVERVPRWIRRVNVSSAGTQASHGGEGVLSANGRSVAFVSGASSLVRGDTNGVDDVFVHDRATGRTSRVSVAASGAQGNHESYGPAISADGRYVAFTSSASNLVRRDTNGRGDVFVHDRATGRTSRVSVSNRGTQADGSSGEPRISAGGRYVAFTSSASNLVRRDTNGRGDVFVHDRATGRTSRVSVSSTGSQANRQSYRGGLSADGRYVAFESGGSNLVPGDTNRRLDVFVHDRVTGQTSRVSTSRDGTQINGWSYDAAISPDGHWVTFTSVVVRGHGTVFVHDRATGQTHLVAPGSAGSTSADGRLVALTSDAPYLVPRCPWP